MLRSKIIGVFCIFMILFILFIFIVAMSFDHEFGPVIMIAVLVSFTGTLSGIIITRENDDKIISKLIGIEKKLNIVKPANSNIDSTSQNLNIRSISKYTFAMSTIYVVAGIMLIIILPLYGHILGAVVIVLAIWQAIETIVIRN